MIASLSYLLLYLSFGILAVRFLLPGLSGAASCEEQRRKHECKPFQPHIAVPFQSSENPRSPAEGVRGRGAP